jgi:site-specific recombinase XerD
VKDLTIGVYDTPTRRRAIVDLGRAGRKEKRFPLTTDLRTIQRWRHVTTVKLETRARRRSPGPRGWLATLINQYLARPEIRKLASWKSRCSDARAWLPALGSLRSDRITDEVIEAEVQAWLAAGVARWTIRHRLTALRKVLDDGTGYNPARDVKPPAKPQTIPRALDYATIRTTFNQMEPSATKGFLLIMAFCGFRPCEILRTERRMVRLDSHAPYAIRPTAKGGDIVTLPLSAEGVLGWQMFLDHDGFGLQANQRPRTFCNANRDWQAAMTRAGFEPTRAYDLVHSYCTQLLWGGYDITLVQKARGHRDIRTTMIYTKVAIDPRLAHAVHQAFDARTPPLVLTSTVHRT